MEITRRFFSPEPGLIQQQAGQVDITFYTDPLCCWSWSFEPQWRRLQYEFQGLLSVRYVMSGLLASWKDFHDPVSSVTRPIQMGPVWHEAALQTGMPVYDRIWVEDAPASSYPACIAVKCAALQSPATGTLYLRKIREAVMLQGRNIARQEVLMEAAEILARDNPALLDMERFRNDLLASDRGIEAFRADLHEAQSRHINRFPTLIMRSAGKPSVIVTGYRPYPDLREAFSRMIDPQVQPRQSRDAEEYASYWGSITDREIAEVFPPLPPA